MARIKILSGFRQQDAFYIGTKLTIDFVGGTRRIYQIKEAVETVNKISEDKKRVIFDVSFRDGASFRGESTNAVFHEFSKYAGASTNANFVTHISPKKARSQDRLTLIVTLIILLFIGYSCTISTDEPGQISVASESEKQSYAWVKCQDMVRSSLKAPKTADFPWGINVKTNGNLYIVNSYVDAQNSFSALIRTYYHCELEHDGGEANQGWVVKSFSMSE